MKIRHLIPLTLLFFTSYTFAGTQQGHVKDLLVRASDGLIYFFMDGTPSGKPICAKNPYWIIRDENSNAGKQQLALLLAAQATGKTIVVTGLNSCNRWHDGEDVDQIDAWSN